MNRPPFKTMVAGHPIAVFVAGSLVALSIAVFVHNTESWPMLAIFGLTMHRVMAAHEARVAYKDWQTAWDAMAPDDRPRRRSRRWLDMLVLAVMGTGFVAWQTDPDAVRHAVSVGGPVALVVGLVALPVLGVRALCRRLRARRQRRSFAVAVIARPTLPTPGLADAYAALPPYCHALLRGRQ